MLIFTVLANFLYFPCISDRNLFILLNLLQNYPVHKIDHLSHLRIHSLYRDQQFVPISFVSIHASCLCDAWINFLVCTIVYYAWDLQRRSSVSDAWMHAPISGSPFNLYSFDLYIFPIDSYAWIMLKFGLLSCSFSKIWHWLSLCKWIHVSSPQISLIG